MKKTILILDDETYHIEILLGIVEDFCKVVFARSIKDAEQLIAVSRPDLILMDNQVKDGYGVQFCKKIKSREETKHIPVIIVSASTDRDTILLGLEAGALDFICKPIDVQLVRLKIINHLADIENNILRFTLPEVT